MQQLTSNILIINKKLFILHYEKQKMKASVMEAFIDMIEHVTISNGTFQV
jgi:hypothetical protein